MQEEANYGSFDLLFGDYQSRAQKTLNGLDMAKLELISRKSLTELNDEDFKVIGLVRQKDPDFELLYAIENLDRLKIYLTIENGCYFLRGFRLRLIKQITTTHELIKDALLDWKLKLE